MIGILKEPCDQYKTTNPTLRIPPMPLRSESSNNLIVMALNIIILVAYYISAVSLI